MAWAILVGSGVLEAVWATARGKADGVTKVWPSIVFLIAMTLSTVGLSTAMRPIPIGTAYAVWVGIGAALRLDECALWLRLQDVYWTRQGRANIDAVVIAATIVAMGILGGPFWVAVVERMVP